MKVPRGVSADQLIKALERLGYKPVRQKGSHVRLRNDGPPVHFITVPFHDPLKIGTLPGHRCRGCCKRRSHHGRINSSSALIFLPRAVVGCKVSIVHPYRFFFDFRTGSVVA